MLLYIKKHIFSALPICTECRASDARSRKLDYRITNRLNYNYCTYWNWRHFWFQVQVRNYICVVIHFYFQLLIKFKVDFNFCYLLRSPNMIKQWLNSRNEKNLGICIHPGLQIFLQDGQKSLLMTNINKYLSQCALTGLLERNKSRDINCP